MRLTSILALLPFSILGTTTLVLSFSRGPLPKLTGGFGEETCASCHRSHPLNEGRVRGGLFELRGVPKAYVSGQSYSVTVLVAHPGQSRWGFELAARFADSGKQAGTLVPTDARTQVVEAGEIQYIEHTSSGASARAADGPVEYRFSWVAPDPSRGPVLFNAAGNAADFDNDIAGDYIYTAGAWSRPTGGETEVTATPAPRIDEKWGGRVNETSRLVNLPVPVHLRKGAFEVQIQHRFFEGLPDSSPGDAFGIDSGANINLGLNYAITDRFNLGVSRARIDQIIAWTGTYEIQTRKDSLWRMSVLGGVEGQRNFQRHFSPYLQLAASFDYKRARLFAVPTVVFYSRDRELAELFPSGTLNPDDDHTLSIGLAADVALNSRFSLVGEIVPRLAGFGGFGDYRPTMSGGFEMRSWGHVFNVLVSSSRDFTPAKYAVNSGNNDVSLGFNISRRLR